MKDYRPDDLIQDTKQFLNSEFGSHIMAILDETMTGLLAKAAELTEEHPERYLAKYSAYKEVIGLINSPLDDDITSRG